eukprot:TRINITY_DN13428_c0_g1_i1.p1 TRINITY_DN13428_c0_g1~~TRINITY_DN13428_c0_g1_i1.p1  ORF type:complete len:257 (-),score=25.89 TRINITY_DN13428_c0_g1_i1:57-827(-)
MSVVSVGRTVDDLRAITHGSVDAGDLSLRRSRIIDDDIPQIVELMEADSHWTSLGLTDNGVTDAGLRHLARAVTLGKICFDRLYLSSNLLTADGMADMSQILTAPGCDLQTLGLNENEAIRCSGAECLAASLRFSQLSVLGLSACGIRSPGCVVLAQALQHHQTMTRLFLNGNLICDTGAIQMAAMLCVNRRLLRLGLGFNCLGDAGSESLRASLRMNDVLERLCMFGNSGITAGEIEELEKVKRINLFKHNVRRD